MEINSRRIKVVTITWVLSLIVSSFQGGGSFAAVAQDRAHLSRSGSPFVAGRVLVKFRSDVSSNRVSGLLSSLGAVGSKEIEGSRVRIVELPAGLDEEFAAQAFKAQPEVEFVELDRILAPDELIPDDPNYVNQWHLPKIASPTAWAATTGSPTVTIAILDTGVDSSHPDLASKIVPGWNCYDNNDNTADVHGHGTTVAGAAAASSNNALGVASVAWGCQIMPVRISDPAGYASVSTIATGLSWAADHGARVANISYACSTFSTISSAAQYFQGNGGVVTISSGNNGIYDSTPDNPYVITVGATTSTDALASWSNTGNYLDLAAPGVSIQTTTRGGGFGSTSGTSYSSPIVAGVAALMLSANPDLNPDQVQTLLRQSADDLGTAGWDPGFGWGRVNAAQAVTLATSTVGTPDLMPPVVSVLSPSNGSSVSSTVTVQASASDNVGVVSVSFSVDGTVIGTDSDAPYSLNWDTTTFSNATRTLTATASDYAGNQSSEAVSVTVSNVPGAQPPSITIVSPTQGSTISGSVSVLVNATDDLGVKQVDLYVDGVLKSSAKRAPFTTKWDARRASAGAHTLQCVARDANGNSSSSQVVTVYK
jgi:hypothetical protein